MAIELPVGMRPTRAIPVDERYGGGDGQVYYDSLADALSSLPQENGNKTRFIGLTVGVNVGTAEAPEIKEYWFKSGVTDDDLVEKIPESEGSNAVMDETFTVTSPIGQIASGEEIMQGDALAPIIRRMLSKVVTFTIGRLFFDASSYVGTSKTLGYAELGTCSKVNLLLQSVLGDQGGSDPVYDVTLSGSIEYDGGIPLEDGTTPNTFVNNEGESMWVDGTLLTYSATQYFHEGTKEGYTGTENKERMVTAMLTVKALPFLYFIGDVDAMNNNTPYIGDFGAQYGYDSYQNLFLLSSSDPGVSQFDDDIIGTGKPIVLDSNNKFTFPIVIPAGSTCCMLLIPIRDTEGEDEPEYPTIPLYTLESVVPEGMATNIASSFTTTNRNDEEMDPVCLHHNDGDCYFSHDIDGYKHGRLLLKLDSAPSVDQKYTVTIGVRN